MKEADDQMATAPGLMGAADAAPSVLWPDGRQLASEVPQPQCFVDLNLDQVMRDLVAGREFYELLPILHTPLTTIEAVRFRQAVMADVDLPDIQASIRGFAQAMAATRQALERAGERYRVRQQHRWFLHAVEHYIYGVRDLLDRLIHCELQSVGLIDLRAYLTRYASSRDFIAMAAEAERLVSELEAVRYVIRVRGLRVDLASFGGEADYSEEILATFDRFRQGADKAYPLEIPDSADMDNVEASILDQLAKMYPALFESLADFKVERSQFQDPGLQRFDREFQLYLTYLDYIAPLRGVGLPFCAPDVVGPGANLEACGTFDVVLAHQLVAAKQTPVANDFELTGAERVVVVSGPNQGGKTTFARAFGQLHYLSCLGLPVPGTQARLRLFDHLFTHFERGENTAELRGKLEDDLVRVHNMLAVASDRTVIIFNEMFTSTTFRDALALSRAIMRRLSDLRLTAVWVTFIDELASWNEHTVSMVSTVEPGDLSKRTFKIVRRPADGLAYALSIAQKWGVTLDQIRDRLSR